MSTETPFREVDGQLYRPDESFEPYVSPVEATKRDLLPEETRRCVLQNRVHYALGDFLNGKRTHSLDIARTLLSSEGVPSESADPVDIITAYYAQTDELLPTAESDVTVSPEPFRTHHYDGNELEREVQALVDSVREFEDYLAGGYLHGSFGDREYVTNYSDVDMVLVVSKETLVDSDALFELRRKLQPLARHYYYIDPHQHHETMVIAEPELRAYNRAYLPPAALSRSTSISSLREQLTFRIREDRVERTHSFWRMLQTLRRCVVDDQFPASFAGEYLTADCAGPLYCLKHFTSLVMLLPSLYMTAIDDPVYKSKSFSEKPITNSDKTSIIDRCSRIRRQYPEWVTFDRGEEYRRALWQDPHEARIEYQKKSVPAEIWSLLGDEYFEDALRAGEYLWNQIQSR